MQRISGLDGVRALAITFVVGGHILPHTHSTILRWICGGQDGVGLFFILSGFLVTALLLKEKSETGAIDIPHFYFRRAMRIVPPLFAYLLVVICIGYATGDPVPARVISSVVFFYHNMTHEGTWMVEHTWSLAVEEQFYLLWPLILVLTLRISWRTFVWLSFTLILSAPIIRMGGHLLHIGWMRHKESYLLPTRMDALLSGCLVAALVGSSRFESFYRRIERWIWVAAVFLFVISPYLSRRYWIQYDYPIGFTLNALTGAFFILWLSRNRDSLLGRIANWKPIATIGVMSYSIYLWQTLAAHYADGLLRIVLCLAFIAIMTILSFYLVERPAAATRSYLEKTCFRKKVIELANADSAPSSSAFQNHVGVRSSR
jgi:peptidoglycan/LPS O-acetylase OafA/YrhL